MCIPTDRQDRQVSGQQLRGDRSPYSIKSESANMERDDTHFYKYAKRFAFVTLVTAYLGKRVNEEPMTIIALGDGSGLLGLGLYEYAVPGLIHSFSSRYLVYFVLFYIAVNRCVKVFNYYMYNLRRATSEAIQSATSMHALSRIRSTVSTTCVRLCKKGSERCVGNESWSKRTIAISASESFLSVDIMENMTLRDVGQVFSYAIKMNQKGFDRADFLMGTRAPAKQAIEALEHAMECSRGRDVIPPETDQGSGSDNMDALAFCAAARIFAEWRCIRMVPDGYPKFSFGLSLGRRDLVQNIGKIERAVHKWLDHHHGSATDSCGADTSGKQIEKSSPTLRQLLQHEIDIGIHPNLPVLLDNSAASGLLWTKRQLQYQTAAMDNNSRVPMEFPTPKAAYSAAYQAVYEKYHGFLARTVFQSTFDSAPGEREVLRHMNIPYDQDAKMAGRSESNVSDETNPIEEDETWVQLPFEDDEDNQVIEVNSQIDHIYPHNDHHEETDHEMDFGEKVLQIFSSVFGHCVIGKHASKVHESRNVFSGIQSSSAALAGSVRSTPETQDVPFYVSILRSLEQGLDSLIAELNTNDPSRV